MLASPTPMLEALTMQSNVMLLIEYTQFAQPLPIAPPMREVPTELGLIEAGSKSSARRRAAADAHLHKNLAWSVICPADDTYILTFRSSPALAKMP